MSSAGFNSAELSNAGLSSAGLSSAGFNKAGFNSAGFNSAGFNRAGLSSAGLSNAGFMGSTTLGQAITIGLTCVRVPWQLSIAPAMVKAEKSVQVNGMNWGSCVSVMLRALSLLSTLSGVGFVGSGFKTSVLWRPPGISLPPIASISCAKTLSDVFGLTEPFALAKTVRASFVRFGGVESGRAGDL